MGVSGRPGLVCGRVGLSVWVGCHRACVCMCDGCVWDLTYGLLGSLLNLLKCKS